jgi:hypothetical protein
MGLGSSGPIFPWAALPTSGHLAGVELLDKVSAIFLEHVLYLLERKFHTGFSVLQ